MDGESNGGGAPFLIRLALPDRRGTLAHVAGTLAAHGVDILRVEVVGSGNGVVVDDLLLAGGDVDASLAELGRNANLIGRREHAELPDPGLAMAGALAKITGAPSLGAARHAIVTAALELVAADAGVLLRDAGHGWLRPVAATSESLPPIRQRQASLARAALGRGTAQIAAPGDEWAPPQYQAALGRGCVLAVPAGVPPFVVLDVVRHDGFPYVEAETERLRALLLVAVGTLHALGDRVVRAPDGASARLLEAHR